MNSRQSSQRSSGANNYDRVASIERIFCDRYGEASATLRDILVSASMLDAPQGHHVSVAGATFEAEEIIDEADRFIGPAAARLIADIARVRTQTQSPTPLPAEIALPDPEVPPRLLDGARRRYFLCPCCGDRFARPHTCRQGCCTTPALPYLNLGVSRMVQVTMLCAYSERSSNYAYGQHSAPRPRRLIPFGRSVVGRARSGHLIFVSPLYAYAILRTKVQRAFPNSTNLCVEMSDAGIHLSETLPDIPTEGDDHDALLSIHSVKRVARTETLALDHWWYRDDLPPINRHEGTVRAYATAYDVFTFRSRPRSEPAVLNTRFYRSGKEQVEHCDLIAAQVGDRVDSPFGPRVIAIERLARKPAKDASARSGAKTDHLTHVVRDGDTWKKITLTVDPIETYDDQALTQAVLAELRSYRHGDNAVISTGLLTHFGAAGIVRMLDMAESFDDHEAMIGPSFDLERFLEGYSDAVDYVATRLRHAILCPDCGVYEDCHGEPLPCGKPRSQTTTQSPKTPANPSEQLAFL